MPGIMVASKLDSSNTMTMCGSLRATWQLAPAARFKRSMLAGSASSTAPVLRSTAATATERTNLEMYWCGKNSSSRSVGTANERAASAARQTSKPSTARLRRKRNVSTRQRTSHSGIVSATASASFNTRPKLTLMKNRNVAKSMSIRSTTLAVIISVLCLNCDNTIRITMNASESTAEVSGRRSKASQKKLSTPQARRKAARAVGSSSDQSKMPKAAKCSAARNTRLTARRRLAARRFLRSVRAVGMI